MDTGLCAYLCGMPSADILEKSAFVSAFYETYVISEIVKSFYNGYQDTHKIYYYRDKDQYEVGLIIESFDSIYPIEIKKRNKSCWKKQKVQHVEKVQQENKYRIDNRFIRWSISNK